MNQQWAKPDPPKRPLLLAIFSGIMIAQAVTVFPLLFFIIAISAGDSPITINGVERTLGDIRLPILAVLGTLWFGVWKIGFGLWRGRRYARHAYFGVILLSALLVALLSPPQAALAPVVLSVLFIGWYLYGKHNVKAFFMSEPQDPIETKTFRGMG